MATQFDKGPTLNSELAKALEKSTTREREAELKSGIDSLTGVFNRRSLDEKLPDIVKKLNNEGHKRESDPDAVIVIVADIDHFKPLNDDHGHSLGDNALREVAARLTEVVNGRGKVFRSGGDEFTLIVEIKGDSSDAKLEEVFERIKERVNSGLSIPVPNSKFDIVVSMGYTTLKKGEFKTAHEVHHEADQKMYATKKANGGERRE